MTQPTNPNEDTAPTQDEKIMARMIELREAAKSITREQIEAKHKMTPANKTFASYDWSK